MAAKGYKKYMKQDARTRHPLIQIFIVSFFGMLLLCVFLINSVAKKMSVDTSIGDYKEQQFDEMENKNIVDNRLEMIQNEDQNRTFSDLMKNPDDVNKNSDSDSDTSTQTQTPADNSVQAPVPASQDIVYKVFIGSYTSVVLSAGASSIYLSQLGQKWASSLIDAPQ